MDNSKHQGDFFEEYHNEDTALVVNDGVEQPPVVNPYIKNQIAYLNKWLTKYNTKHKTKFTCLGIEVEGA